MSEDTPKTFTEAQVQELIQTRTAELRDSRNALQSELNELRPAASAWEKKAVGFQAELETLSEVRSQLDALQTRHTEAEKRWGQDRVLLSAGIADEDVANVLRQKYEKAEEPGEFQAWFEREGRQTRLVAAFLAPNGKTDASSSPLESAPSPQASPAMPQSNNGRKPAPPAAQPYTPGAVSEMSREEFARAKESLLQGLTLPI